MASFKELFAAARENDSFWVEKAILEFTSDIYGEMKRQGKTNTDLAVFLDTSPAYITKIFKGEANFTIKSMVKLSRALGCRLHVKAVHDTKKISWSHCPKILDPTKPTQTDSYNSQVISDAILSIAA